MPTPDEVYKRAVKELGTSEERLRDAAQQIFASMLYHAMRSPEQIIWTATRIRGGKYDVEVNIPAPGRDYKAPLPELDGTFPAVLYFPTEADRNEFVQLVQKAKPGMKMRNL